MFVEPRLELDDIQAHILFGFGSGFQRLIGLKVVPGRLTELRRSLLPWVDKVTTAQTAYQMRCHRRSLVKLGQKLPRKQLMVAISFSRLGLKELSDFQGPRDTFFNKGAAAGAVGIGDEVDSTNGRPLGWIVGDAPDKTPDIFIVLAAPKEDVATAEAELIRDLDGLATIIYRDEGRRLINETEHFGFVDGISQPAVRGTIDGKEPLSPRAYPDDDPLALQYSQPGQPLVWPGQYLFGYPTQRNDGMSPGEPIEAGNQFVRNGSLLVFRRLKQDVAAFENAMNTLAQDYRDDGLEVDAETVAAWCVGRWKDGTPITLSPSGPDPEISGDSIRRNGFLFDNELSPATLNSKDDKVQFPGSAKDTNGIACPFFAHIRKVNPRDQVVDQGSSGITLRSQMLRRGIPYGPNWPGNDDGEDRGLLFMAYQTSIGNQFHRLMTLWVNNTFAPPPGEGIDPLIGAPSDIGRPLIRRIENGTVRATLPGRWVTATGAGYFFAPGIKSLRQIIIGEEEFT